MTVRVETTIKKEFTAECSPSKAFAQLADISATMGLFPKLEKLVNVGDGVWRWEMEKTQAGNLAHQVIYAVKYTDNGSTKIHWSPVPGEGNAEVSGDWVVQGAGASSTITFQSRGHFDVPVPKLMKSVAESLIVPELENR
ncbi:MAG: hypothetical protein HC848_06780 [Limnobacter sp.]|nr:hypothetical protein [Limnobacter sp.]